MIKWIWGFFSLVWRNVMLVAENFTASLKMHHFVNLTGGAYSALHHQTFPPSPQLFGKLASLVHLRLALLKIFTH